jgi:hypothetical protein
MSRVQAECTGGDCSFGGDAKSPNRRAAGLASATG